MLDPYREVLHAEYYKKIILIYNFLNRTVQETVKTPKLLQKQVFKYNKYMLLNFSWIIFRI